VGLGGELRAVNRIDQRISEAEKLGFTEIYVSKYHQKAIKKGEGKIQVRALSKLSDVLEALI
jgi:DNA repair protein RadA/Sms